jgi:uncharacterized protein YidB (DUF937 family)
MLKKLVAPVVAAGILVGGATAVSAGVASASSPTAPATAGAPHVKAWLKDHRHAIRVRALVISAKAIGISPQDLKTELKSGKSVAQVAGEHGVSTQTVVNDLVTAADARVDKAVANHKLTADQAAKLKAAIATRIGNAVNHVF